MTNIKHFQPQKCVDRHVYVIRQETQKSGENITEFNTRLQLLACKCEFTDLQSQNYETESEEHITYVARNAVPKAIT